ncbi:hypothetical protein JYU34_018456 [Plutella xylostella]|uniref:Uncharacterized protein n=1 Tax=Plutella xylostella TaxID=51655 RepID=A0ABQ7PYD0_PLUXY|nr:hypothetical protein JYU34_018456 [Plutella xylostella]
MVLSLRRRVRRTLGLGARVCIALKQGLASGLTPGPHLPRNLSAGRPAEAPHSSTPPPIIFKENILAVCIYNMFLQM